MNYRRVLTVLGLLCSMMTMQAQQFFNLTAEEVKIDTVLPRFEHTFQLGGAFADSAYTVSIDYPEFIDMTPTDVARYQRLCANVPPPMPAVQSYVGVSRKQGALYVSFTPLACQDGRMKKLVSFKLTLHATPAPQPARARRKTTDGDGRYAQHSVLATGQWAKISVAQTGVHQLTDALVRQAGFSNPRKVKIYGYGGALQPERLTGTYLEETDDLQEVPTCEIGGRRLFYGVGPVSWATTSTTTRTRNPYSDYGYYFLTENDAEPLTVDSAAFVGSFYPSNSDYHSLYEQDSYAWYHSGRNLYEAAVITTAGNSYDLPAHDEAGRLMVQVTSNGVADCDVLLNDSLLGTIRFTSKPADHVKAIMLGGTYNVGRLQASNVVTLKQASGEASMRLDYISLTQTTPAPLPDLRTASLPVPRYVYRITNQDHHADPQTDMVIIIPTTQKLLAQAQRLKQLHEAEDSLRVTIVPADELFNEFSSGTPDANAYRRYLKMLYDRAETEADQPRYLLLFGDGAWDNRMLTSDWRTCSPDDFLLCYESEESFSETTSYVSDDYFCMLDDGEGGNLLNSDKPDVGVGRLPARTDAEAKILVDKIISYHSNEMAGSWQNTLCFLADDGNQNGHMKDAEAVINTIKRYNTGYDIKKIYWDAYDRTTSATGNSFPDATRLAKQQMQTGALVMNYSGHGAPYCLSHEQVLVRSDFADQTSLRLPLWVTASCDIMPYDSQEENIGETAMFNPKGGAIAFFGTTRTVYSYDNRQLNSAFMRHVLDTVNGRRNALGDAVRLAKTDVVGLSTTNPENKLHFTLLGDPALVLAAPTQSITVDSINGQAVSTTGMANLSAGTVVTVKGHVNQSAGFNGVVTMTVKDVEEQIVCKLNNPVVKNAGSDTAYVFRDRPQTIYHGSDSVRNGQFAVTFAVPQDISYNEVSCLMTLYAVSNDKRTESHGQNDQFAMSGEAEHANDGIGPSIYCYLNSSEFTNGGQVNTTPYFYAQLTDKDGISAAGSGVGHDLELVVDGDLSMTYNLNEYFQYDFGDYRSGSVGYRLPELSAGEHRLVFRAWDIFNNSSVAELRFTVVEGLTPRCFSVDCTPNPATTTTSFIINHDRAGSEMDVELEVFDASGRLMWRHGETGLSTDSTYTLNWDLTTDSGRPLQTGVYLYRVLISSDGSKKASQARKLIILNHN